MNVYDSEKIFSVLASSEPVVATLQPDDADILVMNTCSIREKAAEKVFGELGRWRKLKEKRTGVKIGVGGCVASQEGQSLLKRAPFVDVVFGPQTLHRLPSLLQKATQNNKAQLDISFPAIEKFDSLPRPQRSSCSAYVSIMEGCNKYCSFCIVPYTRGAEISRPFDDVIAEIVQLSALGVREVTLLGQNVNAYRGKMHDEKTADLATLIRYVAEIDGIDRIRFTTSHPLEFNDRLIEAYALVPKLANQLHLPIQSGSDKVLMKMKRNHTALEYKAIIRKLRKVRPNISITSDFIVGFPGEGTDEFNETLELVKDIGFDNSYSFIYSKRPGTPAAFLEDNVALEVKKQRLAELQSLLSLQAKERSDAMLGSSQKVLITGIAKKDKTQVSGRTECNRVVNLTASHDMIGKIVNVVIEETLPNSLRGSIILEKSFCQ